MSPLNARMRGFLPDDEFLVGKEKGRRHAHLLLFEVRLVFPADDWRVLDSLSIDSIVVDFADVMEVDDLLLHHQIALGQEEDLQQKVVVELRGKKRSLELSEEEVEDGHCNKQKRDLLENVLQRDV